MKYKKIEHKLLIEPLMRDDIDTSVGGIQVYCFNGKPKFILRIYSENEVSTYDENLNITEDIMNAREKNIKIPADDLVKQSIDLSKKLSAPFNFVRVDWMVFNDKLYFEELTFTPYNGFMKFKSLKNNIKFGDCVEI